MDIISYFKELKKRKILDYLKNISESKLIVMDEKKLLKAFHIAALKVSAYRYILSNAGIKRCDVQNIEQFRAKVPLLDKESTLKNLFYV